MAQEIIALRSDLCRSPYLKKKSGGMGMGVGVGVGGLEQEQEEEGQVV